MKVAFRVDSSLVIGTGHVMRCLALAEALDACGAEIIFLSRNHLGNSNRMIEDRGFELISIAEVSDPSPYSLDTSYSSWLGVDPKRDAEETRLILGNRSVDWLVVDHYSLDSSWELSLRPCSRWIMVIDDLANRDHVADVLLDQNLGKSEASYSNRVNSSCRLLLGPQFALLRREFADLKDKSLSRRAKWGLKKLLVTMGGVDLENVTGELLSALNGWVAPKDFELTVVIGLSSPWHNAIAKEAKKLAFPTEVIVGAQNMAALMCDADLAIGAAGSTAWERCCMGLPTIQLVLAENQLAIAKALCFAGAAYILERTELNKTLGPTIDQLLHKPSALSQMASAAAALVDGKGAIEVAGLMKRKIFE
jgi:UDP-2,4-diacetamido-2,4,6-trideoxy-beta-L-altropyranose hydrolase